MSKSYMIFKEIKMMFQQLMERLKELNQSKTKEMNQVTHTSEPSRRFNSICYDDDDDDEESTIPLSDIISQLPPFIVITTSPPVLPIEDLEVSLIMGNEELNTIPEKESDEFIKSSVEDLFPIPSESEIQPGVIGFTDEPPLEENDDLFDLKSKDNKWKKILYDAPINDLMTEDKVFDPEILEKIFSLTYDCPDFEDSHARGFVHRPLELLSLACLYIWESGKIVRDGRLFLTAYEGEDDGGEGEDDNIKLRLVRRRDRDGRQHNLPTSFETYDDVLYPTHRDACYACGLLVLDKEYIDDVVWEKTWHLMADDVLHKERKKQNDPDEQKCIYANILDAVKHDKGGIFFVYNYGGTGKTYLYKTMTATLRSKGKIVLNIASSGIAALLLDRGRTAHSRFVIPINVVKDSMCSISTDNDLADLLHKTKLITWDEAPILNK
uniref:ATP-dependent DNA helicase n=1 Tax=Tanacetum cinerariifolium TaxID=118510 RepID=A0A6L2ME56_TANCI|nr:ATP-dependent DNA helicase PIF1-like [Tanacetum cinerariifolium]